MAAHPPAVRRALTQDATAVAAIWNGFIRDTAVTFHAAERPVAEVAALIEARPRAFLVVELGGQVAGFATYFPFRAGTGYAKTAEHTILLLPSVRGRGLGRDLMDRLIADARHAGIHALVAGISGENPDAVRFHAGLGFVEVGRLPEVGRKFGRWMDLVLMQRML